MTIATATAGVTTYTVTNEDFTKGDRTYRFQVEVHYGEEDTSNQWNSEIVNEHQSVSYTMRHLRQNAGLAMGGSSATSVLLSSTEEYA